MTPPPRPPVICYDLRSHLPAPKRRYLQTLPAFNRISPNIRPANSVKIQTAPPTIYEPPQIHTRHLHRANTLSKPIVPAKRTRATSVTAKATRTAATNTTATTNTTAATNITSATNTTATTDTADQTLPSHSTMQSAPFFCTAPLDEDILEVTDIRFFEKAEDKTMLELGNMIERLSNLQKLKEL